MVEFLIEQELNSKTDYQFVENLQIGDKVLAEIDGIYRIAVIESSIFRAPSGCPYINIKIGTNIRYSVPWFDIYPLGSKKVTNTAYVYSKSHRGSHFSGRGTYELVYDGETVKRVDFCTGRKDALNKILNDIETLSKYKINRIQSNYEIFETNINIY